MQSKASKIKEHLDSDGVVQVTTYLRSTLYTKKHADWFSEDAKGNLHVRHGRGTVQLTNGDSALVKIQFGRYQEVTG